MQPSLNLNVAAFLFYLSYIVCHLFQLLFCCLCVFTCFFSLFVPTFLPSNSRRPAAVEAVACPFASPPRHTPSPPHLRWRAPSGPPHLLQRCRPRSPPPPPLARPGGTRSPGASPRPWRRCFLFTPPPRCPGQGNDGPACPPSSPAL